MKFLRPLVFLSILGFFLPSCRPPQDLEFREIKNLTIENLGFNSTTLNADLVYYNPNNYGMELNRIDLDIFLDSTFLGRTYQDFQVAIPRLSIFTLPVKVDLDVKNLIRNGITAALNKEVQIRAIGSIRLGKAGVFKSFKLDYTTVQRIPLF